VPIRDVRGDVVAAINCSAYSGRVTVDSLIAERLEELRISAGKISKTLEAYPALMHSFPSFGTAGGAE
jgi:IclR family pca regulon transcriptional regulator